MLKYVKKPKLGSKPKWVDADIQVSPLEFKIMNSNNQKELLNDLLIEIKEFDVKNDNNSNDYVIEKYNQAVFLRNCLIDIFLKNNSNEYFLDDILDFYDEIKKWNELNNYLKKELWDSFVHETFIYLIAVLFKNRKYKMIYTILTKSYFKGSNIINFWQYFYSYNYDILEKAKKDINKEEHYYSPIAQLWIENIYEPKISKNDFVFGDLLVFNLNVMLIDSSWYWFPLTYVYSEGLYTNNSYFADFSNKLKSRYEINKYCELFEDANVEGIRKLLVKMVNNFKNQNRYRYSTCFDSAEMFSDFLKPEEVGMYN